MTDEQKGRIIGESHSFGDKGAISKYGKMLYNICSPDSDLKPLIDKFMFEYKSDESTHNYSENERIKLADFYCECKEFESDESDIWNTEYETVAASSESIRTMAAETIDILEPWNQDTRKGKSIRGIIFGPFDDESINY